MSSKQLAIFTVCIISWPQNFSNVGYCQSLGPFGRFTRRHPKPSYYQEDYGNKYDERPNYYVQRPVYDRDYNQRASDYDLRRDQSPDYDQISEYDQESTDFSQNGPMREVNGKDQPYSREDNNRQRFKAARSIPILGTAQKPVRRCKRIKR